MSKNKTNKGILINSQTREITEVEVGDYKDIQAKIGVDCFTLVELNRKGDALYVDDEGLLKLTPETNFIYWKGYHQPLAGNGLILGCNPQTGNSKKATLTLEEVKENVTFLTMRDVQVGCAMGKW